MEVLIGVDGGGQTGLGHASRCSVLASALREQGAEVTVVVRGDAGAVDWLRARGCEAVAGADLPSRWGAVAVLDRKGGAGEREAATVRSWARRLAVIDDASAARLIADLAFYPWAGGIERLGWEGARGSWYAGLDYALIDSRFADLGVRALNDELRGRPRRILVTFGGSDPQGLTASFLRSFTDRSRGFALEIVAGPCFSGTDLALSGELTVHHRPTSLLDLMKAADLAVVGFGVTVAECLAAGVPCIAISHVPADTPGAEALAAEGLIAFAGVGPAAAARAARLVDRLAAEPESLRGMRARGVAAVDGQGTQRVARMLARLWGGGGT